MVNTSMLSRQPTQLDYADSTKFVFKINKLPLVEFFTTQINLPGISLGDVVIPTPFKELPVQGHTLTYENLEIQFIIDESFKNYIELHQWLVGIGFPKARTQFESFRQSNSDAFPTANSTKGEATNPGSPTSASATFGDATLIITSSKNNPLVEVRFSDLYPVSLGAIQFNQQESDVTYLTTTCTFSYKLYEIFTL